MYKSNTKLLSRAERVNGCYYGIILFFSVIRFNIVDDVIVFFSKNGRAKFSNIRFPDSTSGTNRTYIMLLFKINNIYNMYITT